MCAEVQQLAAIVRIWKHGDAKGDALILFPDSPADYNGRYCESWDSCGGHGGADYAHIIRSTRPATAQEAADVKRRYDAQHNCAALSGNPVELALYKRRTSAHRRAYREPLAEMA